MKPLIIYHANCTDGFAAAYCAWLKFGDGAEYLPANYGDDIQFDFRGRDVYVLDFSYDPERTKFLIEFSSHFTWLDHHKTAFENWAGEERQLYVDETEYTHIVLDNSKSGAMLAWEHFNPEEEAPDFIKFIDDRDRWQWKYENSAAFHAGMAARKPWTFEQWKVLNISDGGFYRAIDEGIVLLKTQDAQVKSSAKYATPCIIRGSEILLPRLTWMGLAVNTNVHMSEVGHELAKQSNTYGLIWYLGPNGTARVSLRSCGDYDVSAIARVFGGGGHKNSAGFLVPIATLLEWLK